MFAADWDGRIYHFDSAANFLDQFNTTFGNLIDIDLSENGLLAVGGRFGEVAITDINFSTFNAFSIGSGGVTYLTFVPTTIPEPNSAALLIGCSGLFLMLRRQSKSK